MKKQKRSGIAAVEAAICLPVLVLILMGSIEINKILSLKQQAQLLSSTASRLVLESPSSLQSIETEVEAIAESMGILGCSVAISDFESEIVVSKVEIDAAQNYVFSLGLQKGPIVSSSYSFHQ